MINENLKIGDTVVVCSFDSVNHGRKGKVYSVFRTIGVEFEDGTKLRFSRQSLSLVKEKATCGRFLGGWVCFDGGDVDFDRNNPMTIDTLIAAVDRDGEMIMSTFNSDNEFKEILGENIVDWDYAIGLKNGKLFFASNTLNIQYQD